MEFVSIKAFGFEYMYGKINSMAEEDVVLIMSNIKEHLQNEL